MKKLLFFFLLAPSLVFSQLLQEKDKQLHFAAGALSGTVGHLYFFNKTQDKKTAIIAGISTSLLAGLAKETYDASQGGKFDGRDILATTLGGITVNITIPLFTKKPLRLRKGS